MSVYIAKTTTAIIEIVPHPKTNPNMSQAISLKSLPIYYFLSTLVLCHDYSPNQSNPYQ